MIQLETGAWVLVADGKKALFFRNDLNTRNYDLQVVRQEALDNPASHMQGTDRPGRASSGPNARGAAFEETDWHELAEAQFAGSIAAILNRAAQNGDFSSVVIVAPPAVLGKLRPELSPATVKLVHAEIPKTLTNHPVEKIADLVKSALDAM